MKSQRSTSFVMKVLAMRRQRLTTKYFRRYTIFNNQVKRKLDYSRKEPSKKDIIDRIKPHEDELDRRIYYELTGLRYRPTDYDDTSEEVGDLSIQVDNLVTHCADVDDESIRDFERPLLITAENRDSLVNNGTRSSLAAARVRKSHAEA